MPDMRAIVEAVNQHEALLAVAEAAKEWQRTGGTVAAAEKLNEALARLAALG